MALKNPAKAVFDTLTPDAQTERLTFRRFRGADLAKAVEGGDVPKPAEVVVLKVNPSVISYAKPKITQKIQTASPNRFVVFDWGTDLTVMTINGNTGNLLPDIIQDGFNPLHPVMEDIANTLAPGKETGGIRNGIIGAQVGALGAAASTGILPPEVGGAAGIAAGTLNAGAVTAAAQNIMLNKLSYTDLIGMSPKYKTFLRLQDLYEKFDADQDVLTLELGDSVLRGYFLDFSFDQTAENPWNWKYTVVFSSLIDLTKFSRRGDDTYREGRFIV